MKRRSQEKKTSSPSPKRQHRIEIKKSNDIHVPTDLTLEILSRLPVKSTARFKCVSKLWSSLITPDSIMTWSLAKPCRLLVLFFDKQRLVKSSVFSLSGKLLSTNNGYKYTKQDSHILDSGCVFNNMYQYTHGLICYLLSYGQFVIHNPTTRESLLLPKIKGEEHFGTTDGLLGYDPVENQYKVLCVTSSVSREFSCQIFTLGDRRKQWRNIRGLKQFTSPNMFYARVCIDGKIYFLASTRVMSFDVRSEIFLDHGEIPYNESWNMTLVNYQGKVGLMGCSKLHGVKMFIMEDATKKQEWSNITRFMGCSLLMDLANTTSPTTCVTLNGEFVILSRATYRAQTLYAKFYDLKNKTRRVELESTSNKILKTQGIVSVFCVPDHVEIPISLLELFH